MRKTWKNISTYVIVALVSVGATYGTYKYLDANKANYTMPSADSYGRNFDQGNFRLASINSTAEYPDFTAAAESTVHAVVHIKSTVKSQAPAQQQGRRRMVDPFEYFFGFGDRGDGGYQFGEPQPRVGFGSGVIISKDGYIITNNHVIDKATEIEVTLNDNGKYTAKLVGTDPVTDIALLKIEGKEFLHIPFGDSDKLKVGEWVLAVGNPFNLTSTVTAGIVSAKGRGGIGDPRGGTGVNIQSFIQTDAAVNPGNSGGALVNTRGELVGINTAIYSETGNFAGYSFAVPISIAGKVVADIKEYGTVQRAVLGVLIRDLSNEREVNPDKTKDIKAKDGVYIGGFQEKSPAKQAGIEEGDVLIAVNGTAVRTSSELQEQINRYRPGDKVKVKVLRNNAEKEVVVTLKTSDGSTALEKKKDGVAIVGAAFKALTDETLKKHGISYGIEVAGVDNQGAFHKEGVSKGFIIQQINNQPVSTPEQVESIIGAAATSKEKVLFISGFYPTTGAKKYYAIDLDK